MLNQFEQFICNNANEDWDYECLSRNPYITWEIVQANPDIPWNYICLSFNPNITLEIIKANPDIPWNFNKLSSNTFKYNNRLQCIKTTIIQKWYKNIKFLRKIKHISKLNQVNTELKYLPDFGIKFFELKNDFESRI
jgi:hypothetical protein